MVVYFWCFCSFDTTCLVLPPYYEWNLRLLKHANLCKTTHKTNKKWKNLIIFYLFFYPWFFFYSSQLFIYFFKLWSNGHRYFVITTKHKVNIIYVCLANEWLWLTCIFVCKMKGCVFLILTHIRNRMIILGVIRSQPGERKKLVIQISFINKN